MRERSIRSRPSLIPGHSERRSSPFLFRSYFRLRLSTWASDFRLDILGEIVVRELSEQSRHNLDPFVFERLAANGFACPAVPVGGIICIAFLPMQVCVHPRTFRSRVPLRRFVSSLPLALSIPPQSGERERQSGWGFGSGFLRFAEIVQSHVTPILSQPASLPTIDDGGLTIPSVVPAGRFRTPGTGNFGSLRRLHSGGCPRRTSHVLALFILIAGPAAASFRTANANPSPFDSGMRVGFFRIPEVAAFPALPRHVAANPNPRRGPDPLAIKLRFMESKLPDGQFRNCSQSSGVALALVPTTDRSSFRQRCCAFVHPRKH